MPDAQASDAIQSETGAIRVEGAVNGAGKTMSLETGRLANWPTAPRSYGSATPPC